MTLLLTRRYVFIPVLALVFFVFLGMGREFSAPSSKQSSGGKGMSEPGSLFLAKNPSLAATGKKQEKILSLMKRLQDVKRSDELESLCDEVLSLSGEIDSNLMRGLMFDIALNWGELAPLTGLQKLDEMPDGEKSVSFLFWSWSVHNPAAAVAYYEEHYKGKQSRLATDILDSILSAYVSQDQQRALKWFSSLEGGLSSSDVQGIKSGILATISREKPELIPDLLKEWGRDGENVSWINKGYGFYEAGLNWGLYNAESREWVEKLPLNARIYADTGRIMAISRGNLEKIGELANQLPLEEQVEVKKRLVDEVRYSGLAFDLGAYTCWAMDTLPEKEFTDEFKRKTQLWFYSDRQETKAWIESLPPGRKKDLFQSWYKERIRDVTGRGYLEE